VGHLAATTFTAIYTIASSFKFTPPTFKGAQADTGHIAGTHKAGACSLGLSNQLNHLLPAGGAG
jgi:hypothetical protein